MKKILLILFIVILLSALGYGAVTQTTNQIYTPGNIVVGNLTLGEYAYYNTSGDIYLGGGDMAVYHGQFGNWPLQYGAGAIFNEHSSSLNITKFSGSGYLNSTTQYICDDTNPFNSYNEDMFIEIISSTPSYEGATGVLTNYVNSSCMRVSFAGAGSDNPGDSLSMSYIVYPRPIFALIDNGDIHFNIGEHPDARFYVTANNATGSAILQTRAIAGANNVKTFSSEIDSKTYSGVSAADILMYTSTGADGISASALDIEGDATGFNNSHLAFIKIDVLGIGINNTVDAFDIDPVVKNIIKVGSIEILDSAYYNDVNITANVTDVGNDATVFANDNDYVYFGNSANFTSLSISLSTGSSQDADLEYYYCNDSGDWNVLSAVADTTEGFRITGGISFSNPSDRGKCNKEFDGTPFSDTNNYTYVALKRTRNFLTVKPILDRVDISGATSYFTLQNDMMKLNSVDTAPELCTASFLGAIYFDISEDDMCVCKSGGWKVISDGSDCT